jgi:hypothetical protein
MRRDSLNDDTIIALAVRVGRLRQADDAYSWGLAEGIIIGVRDSCGLHEAQRLEEAVQRQQAHAEAIQRNVRNRREVEKQRQSCSTF